MATSSIFHNVKIDTPQQAEAFVAALEASENDSRVRPTGLPRHTVESDPAVIRRLFDLNKKSRGSSK